MKKIGVIEKQFEYKGHDCICVFTKFGFRNGYVSVKENKDFSIYDIDCHCGLNYNGKLPEYYNPKAHYYIGFDCGHICDGIDKNQAYKYGLIDETTLEYMYDIDEPVRDLEYVEGQCRKIVDQLEGN